MEVKEGLPVFGSAMNPGVFSISVSETDTMHLIVANKGAKDQEGVSSSLGQVVIDNFVPQVYGITSY